MADSPTLVWVLEEEEEFQVWNINGLFSSLEGLMAYVERQKPDGHLKALVYYVDAPHLMPGGGRIIWKEGRPVFESYDAAK